MGLFDFLRTVDINESVKEYHSTLNAVLLDVRSPGEYREGHIPGSINVPLSSLSDIEETVSDPDTPLFVYCYSGSRSRQAVQLLGQMGYTNVKNVGGISSYKGKVES